MPWVCEVCSLKNVDDSTKTCDLCNAPKGTPVRSSLSGLYMTAMVSMFELTSFSFNVKDPDRGKDPESRAKSKRMSMTALLRAGPEDFDRDLQEARRLEALKNIKGVFGVPLKSSAPRLVCDCLAFIEAHGLNTEGIFRIPGQQDTVDAMRAAYEKDESRNVLGEFKCDNHDVATLFKTFFRMLPQPLVPVSHYDLLMDSVRQEHQTKEDLVAAVMHVVHDIPSPQRECLGLIIHFLKKVAARSDINKMTPANLATCFAPSLLRAPDGASAQQALMDMSAAIGALNILIRSPSELPQPDPEEVKKNTKYKVASVRMPSPVAPPPGMFAGPPPPGMGKPPGFD